MANQPPSADALRAAFDDAPRFTVGIEEEIMLLDPDTLELAPRAPEVLPRLDGDPRFKPELPASQIEIATAPHVELALVMAELEAGRSELAMRTDGVARPAAAGVSPLGSGVGELNALPQYERTLREYASVARRQLVCALQVHVAVGDAETTLAVYNTARSYLPFLAALAANGRFYEGGDSGLASVRPKLGELLPRQGIPPAFASWEDYAAALAWGAESGAFPDSGSWWWELRVHPSFGTLEFRVPDSQATIADAAAVAAVIQALVIWLAGRHEAGEQLPVAATWRIEENRWSACRHGVEGWAAPLEGGGPRGMRACLEQLLQTLSPLGPRLGTERALAHAAGMVEANGAVMQRTIGREEGAFAVARWLAEGFLAPWDG
jgi:carboxylate-amine ligase